MHKIRNSALKVITLTLTNISLALYHLRILSKILIASRGESNAVRK